MPESNRLTHDEPLGYDGFGAPLYSTQLGVPGGPDGPPGASFHLDAEEPEPEKTPLWVIVTGTLMLLAALAVVGIPTAWGLAWLISNWP